MFVQSSLLLRMTSGYRDPFHMSKGAVLRRSAADPGHLTNDELGSSFANELVYRSKELRHVLEAGKSIFMKRADDQDMRFLEQRGVSHSRQRELEHSAMPQSREEHLVTERMNDKALKLSSDIVAPPEMTRRILQRAQRDELRREKLAERVPVLPTSREYGNMVYQLNRQMGDEDEISRLQGKLEDDCGIYSPQRLDAYMLGSDSVFPKWVTQLPWRIRDRVKYGNLGLTEEDEVLRVNLARAPLDRRIREWDRLKAARAYKEGQERMLSPSEIRNARLGKRNFHWLERRRRAHVTMLRRLALRKPEVHTLWPNGQVDLSRRAAVIAQHVENGVETQGKWPLDEDALARARIKKLEVDAQQEFLSQHSSKSLRAINKGVANALDQLDPEEKPVRRISKRLYSFRVTAVLNGDRDEHGRKLRDLQRDMNHSKYAAESAEEMQLRKELGRLPQAQRDGKRQKGDGGWPWEYKAYHFRTAVTP